MYSQFRRIFGLPVVQAQDTGTMVSTTTGRSAHLPGTRVNTTTVFVSEAEIQNALQKEKGIDRLREMFTKDEKGNLSEDMDLVLTATTNTAFFGLLLGTVIGSRMAMEDFRASNKDTVFETKFLASRSYMDRVFLGGVKAGGAWAFRLGGFAFLLIGSSQAISVYRNKSGPLELTAGGAITGGILRLKLGLKGLVAGSIIGSVMGLVAGTLVYAYRYLTNETQEQRHYWQIHDQLKRQKRMKKIGNIALDTGPETNVQGS